MRHYMTGLLFGYLDKEFDEQSQLYTKLRYYSSIRTFRDASGLFWDGFATDSYAWAFLKIIYLLSCRLFLMLWLNDRLDSFSPTFLDSKFVGEFGIKKLDNMGITLLLLFLFYLIFFLTVGRF